MSYITLMDDDSEHLDLDTIHKWESFVNTPIITDNLHVVQIEPYNANRYKGNFTGLLHNELNIPNSAIYLNTRVNGFKSSLEYDGRLEIVLLEPSITLDILNSIRDSD